MTDPDLTLAESLNRDHATLRDALRSLEEAVRSPSEAEGALDQRLRTLRDLLAEHFRREEENGYMETVRQREPRLERAIQELLAEHRQLSLALEDLLRAAQAGLDPALREKVLDWIGHLRQHEVRENLLIEDAFDLDLGAED